ncbi:hypothetical protein ACFX1X_031999 [Malus domestica]
MPRGPAQLGLGCNKRNTPASLGVVTKDEGRHRRFRLSCFDQKNSKRVVVFDMEPGWCDGEGLDIQKPKKNLGFEFGFSKSGEIHTNLGQKKGRRRLQVVGDGSCSGWAWLQAMLVML